MVAPPNGSPSYRRATLLYLVAVVAPTLLLLYLGLQSVQRQRQAIDSLRMANLRLAGERLTAELELRAMQLAGACLREGDLSQLPPVSTLVASPEAARRVRVLFENLRRRHPIAQHFFVLQGDTVQFPLVHTPSRLELNTYLERDHSELSSQFGVLFAEAEVHELQRHELSRALALYRQSYELSVPASLKALALARMARCLRKLNRRAEAEDAYRLLADEYGNLYDPFRRPYRLVALLELDDLAEADREISRGHLARAYSDLAGGSWELSAEQVDYFLIRLRERLNDPTGIPAPDYLLHLELATALEQRFRHQGPLVLSEVYACNFDHSNRHYQVFYTVPTQNIGPETLIGFAADLDWIQATLLPRLQSEQKLGNSAELVARPQAPTAAPASSLEPRVTFGKIFPFWELVLKAESGDRVATDAHRTALLFAGSTIAILAVLVLGVVLLIRDVWRETQLNRLRADLVSGVSHELKTPLTLIRLYAETLADGGDSAPQERASYSQIITRESERLSHLVDKVLSFSRIERGQGEYQLREESLAPIIAQTTGIYAQYLRRRGFSIETDLATELPPVLFDPDAVAEALVNLMDNAAKYAGQAKYICIHSRADRSPERGRVIIEVEDRGIGISSEEQQKIFQQFYRGQGGTGKGGYGLGLFLVKHIMDAHHGEIELETEPGRGSRFRLIFPARVAAAREDVPGVT